jgi:putative ABC transport system permease protein
MVSAIVRKSMRDLSKRRARTVFTVLTVALGVMGISLLAIFPLADQGANGVVEAQRLHNLQITVSDVELAPSDIQAMEEIDNVVAAEARIVYFTQMFIGERKNDVYIVGIEDFEDQKVDVVVLDSGRAPGAFEALTDGRNSANGIYDGARGDTFMVVNSTGSEVALTISGAGGSLAYAAATSGGYAMFATDVGTARALGNLSGYNLLAFTLDRTDDESVNTTVEAIRTYLTDHTSVVAFSDLPEVRREGEWPGREMLSNLVSMLYVMTVLALLCSVFLISNTMNTMILEQRREIAQMKAIGARRAQVFRSYLTTATIIGAVGAVAGAFLGLAMVNVLLSVLGGPFGFATEFVVHLPTVALSLLVGIGVVLAAALPALSRSSRMVVREGLEDHGIASDYGSGALDRLLMRGAALPRSVQMGLRNVARKKGRSAATILQVALAVGVLLGLISFGYSLSEAVSGAYSDLTWDISISAQALGGTPLNESLGPELGQLEGVRTVEPTIIGGVQLRGRAVIMEAYLHDTACLDYAGIMDQGRWFTAEDELSLARVAVVGPALAELESLAPDDVVDLMTATGSAQFRIIGVTDGLMYNGQVIYIPLATAQDVLRLGDGVTGFLFKTVDGDHTNIDRTATRIEDDMLRRGAIVDTTILYVMEERNLQANQLVVNLMMVISLIIVLIGLIGLMSTLTMNIIDRTREIGMMRCLGSRARDIRRMFSSEGAFLSFLGWLVGLPIGLLIAYVVVEVVASALTLRIPLEFPLAYVLWSFIVALGGTVLIIQAPLLRATRLRPGDALRYQ